MKELNVGLVNEICKPSRKGIWFEVHLSVFAHWFWSILTDVSFSFRSIMNVINDSLPRMFNGDIKCFDSDCTRGKVAHDDQVFRKESWLELVHNKGIGRQFLTIKLFCSFGKLTPTYDIWFDSTPTFTFTSLQGFVKISLYFDIDKVDISNWG